MWSRTRSSHEVGRTVRSHFEVSRVFYVPSFLLLSTCFEILLSLPIRSIFPSFPPFYSLLTVSVYFSFYFFCFSLPIPWDLSGEESFRFTLLNHSIVSSILFYTIYLLPVQFFFFFYRISLVIYYLFESRGRKNHASSVKLAALAHSCLTRTARDLHFRDFRTFYPVRYPRW